MDSKFLCHGKRVDNGEWVYGYYIPMHHYDHRTHTHHFVMPLNSNMSYMSYGTLLESVLVEVDPFTVSRCAGLTAVKSYRGTEPEDLLVFEGDVIGGRNEHEISDVVCRDGVWMMSQFLGHKPALWEIQPIEIIGTIHDKTEGEG